MSTHLALMQSHSTTNNLSLPDAPDPQERTFFGAELTDESVLPEQFFTLPMTARAHSPELSLVSAVLEDALHCYQRQWISSSRTTKKLAREAEEYIFSDDTSWPFSFVNLCEVFSLNPSYIRSTLRQIDSTQRKKHIHRKRHLGILRRPIGMAA